MHETTKSKIHWANEFKMNLPQLGAYIYANNKTLNELLPMSQYFIHLILHETAKFKG